MSTPQNFDNVPQSAGRPEHHLHSSNDPLPGAGGNVPQPYAVESNTNTSTYTGSQPAGQHQTYGGSQPTGQHQTHTEHHRDDAISYPPQSTQQRTAGPEGTHNYVNQSGTGVHPSGTGHQYTGGASQDTHTAALNAATFGAYPSDSRQPFTDTKREGDVARGGILEPPRFQGAATGEKHHGVGGHGTGTGEKHSGIGGHSTGTGITGHGTGATGHGTGLTGHGTSSTGHDTGATGHGTGGILRRGAEAATGHGAGTTTGHHDTNLTGRHDVGTTGQHGTGLTGRHDAGTTGQHGTGLTGRHDAGTTGQHGTGLTGRHDAGTTAQHGTGLTGRHDAGATTLHETGVTGHKGTGVGHEVRTREGEHVYDSDRPLHETTGGGAAAPVGKVNLGDKIIGKAEQAMGKVLANPEMQQKGEVREAGGSAAVRGVAKAPPGY